MNRNPSRLARALAAALVLLPLVAFAGGAEHSFNPTEDEMKRLRAGEVIVDEYIFSGPGNEKQLSFIATALVDAPPQTCFNTVRDYDHFHEFMPRVSGAKVVAKDGDCMTIRYEAGILWIDVVYYIDACAAVPGRRVEFELARDRENFIEETRGFWEIQPVDGGKSSLVSYSAYLDPGIPVPDFISLRMTRSNIVAVLENVRKRAESGGTWKKDD